MGRREEGAGKEAGGVWIEGKGGKMKQDPPCGRRGRGGAEGDFCAGTGVQDGAGMGDSSPGRALCDRAGGKE